MRFCLIRSRLSRPRTVFTILLLGAGVARGQNQPSALRSDLDQAIQLALAHNHALRAARTQIQQSRAEDMTASLPAEPRAHLLRAVPAYLQLDRLYHQLPA